MLHLGYIILTLIHLNDSLVAEINVSLSAFGRVFVYWSSSPSSRNSPPFTHQLCLSLYLTWWLEQALSLRVLVQDIQDEANAEAAKLTRGDQSEFERELECKLEKTRQWVKSLGEIIESDRTLIAKGYTWYNKPIIFTEQTHKYTWYIPGISLGN